MHGEILPLHSNVCLALPAYLPHKTGARMMDGTLMENRRRQKAQTGDEIQSKEQKRDSHFQVQYLNNSLHISHILHHSTNDAVKNRPSG